VLRESVAGHPEASASDSPWLPPTARPPLSRRSRKTPGQPMPGRPLPANSRSAAIAVDFDRVSGAPGGRPLISSGPSRDLAPRQDRWARLRSWPSLGHQAAAPCLNSKVEHPSAWSGEPRPPAQTIYVSP
jgi:hypothetical protein